MPTWRKRRPLARAVFLLAPMMSLIYRRPPIRMPVAAGMIPGLPMPVAATGLPAPFPFTEASSPRADRDPSLPRRPAMAAVGRNVTIRLSLMRRHSPGARHEASERTASTLPYVGVGVDADVASA